MNGHLISAAAAINVMIFAGFFSFIAQIQDGVAGKLKLHPFTVIEQALAER